MDMPQITLAVTAPSPETAQLHASHGLLTNAITEHTQRAHHLGWVVPEQRPAESQFLAQWGEQLRAEQHRLLHWSRDLQARQIASGALIPQADGSFTVRPPVPPSVIAKRVGVGAAVAVSLLALLTGQFLSLLALASMLGIGYLAIRALIRKGTTGGVAQVVTDDDVAAELHRRQQAQAEAEVAAAARRREQDAIAEQQRLDALLAQAKSNNHGDDDPFTFERG